MRHFEAEQEFLKADIGEDIYIEIPGSLWTFGGSRVAEGGVLARTGGKVPEY